METRSYRLPEARGDLAVSLALGAFTALALFLVMAWVQMTDEVKLPADEIEETLLAYVPPQLEVIEEEPPPPPELEEPPPELEPELPQLSLDQLDIALNPGTGGSLVGDFALPLIGATQRDLGTEDFVDFSELDEVPRPIGVSGFNFPRRLRRDKVNGKIVLLLRLDERGRVLDVAIDSSNLPAFDDFVLSEVRRWSFTPPTRRGQPVRAQARLPIPIVIN